MHPTIAIASVSERDMDLLVMEEFLSSPGFSDWFLKMAIGKEAVNWSCVKARRSVTNSIGESDLEIVFKDLEGLTHFLLIENKIAAALQPLQAERYRLRGSSYKSGGHCARFTTVIVAPAKYFGTSQAAKGFDSRVTYEDLAGWFEAASSLGPRRFYKLAIIQRAIEKGAYGYQVNEDEISTSFWRHYWNLSRRHAPHLEMREPRGKPSGSTFITFHPQSLPRGFEIKHKLTGTAGALTGFVDLEIGSLGSRVNQVYLALRPFLEEDMTVVRATGSAAVRVVVDIVDPNKSAEPQEAGISTGLDAASRLLTWFDSQPEISKLLGELKG